MVRIYLYNIDDLNECEYEKIYLNLSNQKRDKINKFIKKEDKLRTIGSYLLLANSLKFHNINLDLKKDDYLLYNKYQKPYLKNYNLNINLSHSGRFVVLATAQNSIGIDIQKVENIEFLQLAKRFFNKDEYNFLKSLKGDERISSFYEIWTLKESYIKNIGKGLSLPLNSFSIINTKSGIKTSNIEKEYSFKTLYIDKDYRCAVSITDNEEIEEKIEIIKTNQN